MEVIFVVILIANHCIVTGRLFMIFRIVMSVLEVVICLSVTLSQVVYRHVLVASFVVNQPWLSHFRTPILLHMMRSRTGAGLCLQFF